MKITLPVYMEEHAHHFAEMMCDLEGCEDSLYKRRYKKYFEQFCKEAYEQSMTPSGDLKANPTTPKVSPYIYKKLDLYPKIASMMPNASDKELQYVESQFKGALMSLTDFVLKVYGYQTKGENSDFVYKPNLGNYPETDEDSLIQTEVNRYVRLAVVAGLISRLEDFILDAKKIKNEIENYLPKKEMTSGNMELDYKTLMKKGNRESFAKSMFQYFKSKIS